VAPKPNTRWRSTTRTRRPARGAQPQYSWRSEKRIFTVGGTNPALVQAIAAGAPVIARDTPYNREVLGASGVYCSSAPRDIAEAVLSSLNNNELRRQLSQLSLARSSGEYTWGSVCGKYDHVLTELLDS